MLQHQRIFELSQLASLPEEQHKGDRIVDWSLARESDILVFLTERSSDIFAVALSESAEDSKKVHSSEGETSFRSLKWYEDIDLRPVCVSFSPDEDYAVVATVDGSLFIVPVQLLVQNDAPARGKGKIIHRCQDLAPPIIRARPPESFSAGALTIYIWFQMAHATKEYGERLRSLGCLLKSGLGMPMSPSAEYHLRCCGTRPATRASPLPSLGPNTGCFTPSNLSPVGRSVA